MLTKADLVKYQYVVGYGVGQYYDYIRSEILSKVHLDFLCDAKWEQIGDYYDGIKVISPEELSELKNACIIIFSGNKRNYESIKSMLDRMDLPYVHAKSLVANGYSISGKELKQLKEKVYCDELGNRIEFCSDIEDSITITFQGGNNVVKIANEVSVGKLVIDCGREACCSIGKGTEIEAATMYITNGKIEIGEDCLFSYDVTLRNHDTHHIFDRNTKERINFEGNMKIGNHVWIGYGATLLGSATIGDNSVVGTMAVTSSTFPAEVIIAGNPARIIRKDVCWSKDNTNFYNRLSLDDCLAKEAYKYF